MIPHPAETVAEHKHSGDQVAVNRRVTSQQWENEAVERRSTVKVAADPRGVQFLARKQRD